MADFGGIVCDLETIQRFLGLLLNPASRFVAADAEGNSRSVAPREEHPMTARLRRVVIECLVLSMLAVPLAAAADEGV